MKITNESEINGLSAKKLREDMKLTQAEFWGAVCVSNARGCAYETGRTEVPAPIKRLLFLHYVLGVPADTSSKEMQELAKVACPARRARRQMESATRMIDEACELLESAKGAMNASL